jgi:hypothetical protein
MPRKALVLSNINDLPKPVILVNSSGQDATLAQIARAVSNTNDLPKPVMLVDSSGNEILSSLLINVKDASYGARGDGTTDDTSAIQAAINAATSGGGIFFPPGTYKITSGLTITVSGVSLQGAGAGASIIQTPAGKETLTMLLVGDGTNTCADVGIYDLQFLGVTQKTANAAIKLQKCFRSHIERIRTQNQYRAIHVYNSTETWIDDSDLRDTKENGVVFEATVGNGFDCYITNLAADNPVILSGNVGSGILWLGGETLVIQNADVIHFNEGLQIAPPTGQQCRFGFIATGIFDTSYDNCITINNQSGGNVVGITLTQGWAGTATNYGVLIDGGGTGLLQGIRFIGHKSLHNGLAGFRLAAGLDIVLDNCDVIGNSQTVANSRSGIEIASGMTSGSFSIVGCRASNGWQQGNTQSNGINFDAGTYTSGFIADNDLRGNTNNALALNGAVGTLSIKNNQGHNPVGNITAPTFPASTVGVTNNTGYDVQAFIVNGLSAITVVQLAGQSGTYVTTGDTISASGIGVIRIPANGSIKFTYAGGTPTWTWFGD